MTLATLGRALARVVIIPACGVRVRHRRRARPRLRVLRAATSLTARVAPTHRARTGRSILSREPEFRHASSRHRPRSARSRLRRAAAHSGEGGDDSDVVHQILANAELSQLKKHRAVVTRLVALLPAKLRATYLVGASERQQRIWTEVFMAMRRP